MTEDNTQNSKPAKLSARAVEARQERRRRRSDDPLDSVQFHLSVQRSQDDPDYVYYFANDDKGRIQYLTTQDDWDFDEDRNADKDSRNKEGGSRICRAVGRSRDGETLFAYRLKKRRDWFEEDNAENHRRLDARTQRLRETQDDGSGAGLLTGDPKHGYIPPEINTAMPRIRRGSRS
jgi:hypothetical protein